MAYADNQVRWSAPGRCALGWHGHDKRRGQGQIVKDIHLHRALHHGTCPSHGKVLVLTTGAQHISHHHRVLTKNEGAKVCGEAILVLQPYVKFNHNMD